MLPAAAVPGEMLSSVGTGLGTTVKAEALVAVPPGVVAAARLDMAPTGTVKMNAATFIAAKLLNTYAIEHQGCIPPQQGSAHEAADRYESQ